jgi:hypothetical protein
LTPAMAATRKTLLLTPMHFRRLRTSIQ